MNVKFIKNWINWCRKNPIKAVIIFILLFLIGLLIFNLSTEYCWPKKLGITETSKFCNPGTLIVRLGYAIGGVIALLVAVASFERVRALDKTADAQNKTADAQERGNIEERYKNAIEQFGNENPSVRLAGAYGLYHLAKDNEDRRENICDVLCVHIRTLTTSEEPIFNRKKDIATTVGPIFDKESYSERYKDKPSNEVQSILDLLINKDNKKDFPFKSHWINLENAYLNGVSLDRAQLQGASLYEAQLQGANLFKAQLQAADLRYAQLQEAKLWEAQLQVAKLYQVQLQGANLFGAQLQGASLSYAQLQGASLSYAQLQGASLSYAQFQGAKLLISRLQGANLKNAQFQGAYLGQALLQGVNLSSAQFQGADLSSAQFQGADLSSAQLQGTYLWNAQLQGADLGGAQFQGANLEKTDFSGTFTQRNSGIFFNTDDIFFNIDGAINQLKSRKNKKNNIKGVIFSGGLTKEQLDDFKKTTAETLEELNKIKNYDQDRIKYFIQKMKEVEKILEDHDENKKKASYKFLREYIKTIKKGVYPQAEANKIIAMLEEVKKTTETNN